MTRPVMKERETCQKVLAMFAHEEFKPGGKEREFQRRLCARLIEFGFMVDRVSDVPGVSNSLGYDILVTSPTGDTMYVEVKKRPLLNPPSPDWMIGVLEESQKRRRLSVKAFNSTRVSYLVILLMLENVIVRDVTDL